MFKHTNKKDFLQDRVSMTLGSLMNFYSSHTNPPEPEEVLDKAYQLTEEIWDREQESSAKESPVSELDFLIDKFPKKEDKERVKGRYHSSELYNIIAGSLKPKDFYKKKEFDDLSLRRMYWGTVIHQAIQDLYDYEEDKMEYPVTKDITLVGMIDLEVNDRLIEIKTTEDPWKYNSVPRWYNLQCQAYLQMRDIDEMDLWVISWAFNGRIFKIKRDKKVWEQIVSALIKFHDSVGDPVREKVL